MENEVRQEIEHLLADEDPQHIQRGLDLITAEISREGASESRPLFELVASLFALDPLAQPAHGQLLDQALKLTVGFGDWVIPELIKKLDASDLDVQMTVATALSRIGAESIGPLLSAYKSAGPEKQPFIIYALAKMETPKIAQALPVILEAAGSTRCELRDAAIRAIGKISRALRQEDVSEEQRLACLRNLYSNVTENNTAIRSRAVRSLGKLMKNGFIHPNEQQRLKETLDQIMGCDEKYHWDHAFVVRREAQEILPLFQH